MKHIISASALALVLITATPASAEVGGTITRNTPQQSTAINNLVMTVLEFFTWKTDAQSITFDDGRYTANAGCNNIFGEYTLDGTNIDFGEPASTLMYCDGKMEAETALGATLRNATHMTFSNGALMLSNGTTTASFPATLTATQAVTGK